MQNFRRPRCLTINLIVTLLALWLTGGKGAGANLESAASQPSPASQGQFEANVVRLEQLHLLRVPLSSQATHYTCGAAAMQSVLAYFGDEFKEMDLARQLRTNTCEGTDYNRMAAFARRHGYEAEVKTDMTVEQLKEQLSKGIPVICLIQAWADPPVDLSSDWHDGHYVVAIGADDKNLYFMDPWTLGNYTYVPLSDFPSRWHDRQRHRRLEHLGLCLSKPHAQYDPQMLKKMN